MVAALTLSLFACGGDDDDPATIAPTSCQQLAGLSIAASAIGLPSSGATVISASESTSGANSQAYCMVAGRILPVDPSAPDIRFNLALPAHWNGKAAMFGGGGFNGSIPNVTGSPSNTLASAATPLARGYAVFSSDSGHQSTAANPVIDASALVNDETRKNWYGDALKKTRDVAAAIIQARYGRAQTGAYFFGSSTGGREALTVITRWPNDWDGAVAQFPARPVRAQSLAMLANTRALAASGAFLSFAKRGLLHKAALAACDALDGAADGVISNVQRCAAAFDPATAAFEGNSLRCANGSDAGDACLSDAQLAALKTINSPLKLPYALSTGETGYPGYNAYISDFGAASSNPLDQAIAALSIGITAPAFPVTSTMSYQANFADQGIRYMSGGSPTANSLLVDPVDPGSYQTTFINDASEDVTASNNPDLSAFAARGGKLVIIHGTEDMLISPRASQDYMQRLRSRMGASTVDAFARYYEIPGSAHGVGRFFLAWDPVTTLEQWKESNIDPANAVVITDTAGVPGRTRPLCVYPSWAKYTGAGSINSASSFVCSIP